MVASQMPDRAYAIGQAVFLRTDTPDYAEETVPFKTLDELVQICSEPRPNLTLDKVLIFSTVGEEPRAVTLNFMSATKGQRPDLPEFAIE